jgi:predicted RNA-binding protein
MRFDASFEASVQVPREHVQFCQILEDRKKVQGNHQRASLDQEVVQTAPSGS